MDARITFNLEKLARVVNAGLPLLAVTSAFFGYYVSFYFHFLTVGLFILTVINFYYLKGQKKHTLLGNFGILAQFRYLLESIGPELRQYLYANDSEERPFNRNDRSDVYRKAKNIDSSAPFGTQKDYLPSEIKLRHSLFPIDKNDLIPFSLVFGEERGLNTAYTIHKPLMISGMSYGALGMRAVRSLARGAGRSQIPMNTGEGGYPEHHLEENCDLIFQMGTAKFGVRHPDGRLDEEKLESLAQKTAVKMIEIKFSQGAKPGKGGLLPKEKITPEIAELRGIDPHQDVISPPFHLECHDLPSTVKFIRQIQEITDLPVGIKMCFGRESEFIRFVGEMKQQDVFPDYIAIDGAEGGTGAAPRAFMDEVGVPIMQALPRVVAALEYHQVRHRCKIIAAGKLLSAGRQCMALAMGADAVYTARGFMLAIGCIQALQCNMNTCPVGITTHDPQLQNGIDIDTKSSRVESYVRNLWHDHCELLSSMGCRSHRELSREHLYIPKQFFYES
jgi:glutamate synthase domain-containing protein 2